MPRWTCDPIEECVKESDAVHGCPVSIQFVLVQEQHPEVVAAFAKAGHEINAHGWVNDIVADDSDPDANDAWSETDWDKASPPPSSPPTGRLTPQSAAKAIADALDGIARRIREGDLSLPSQGSLTSAADIAATLAALLGVKR